MSSKQSFELHAVNRADIGKGASRRLRHAGKLPAIIYGAGETPQSVTFEHKDVRKATENEAFFSHILTVHIDGKAHNAVVKDMQRHPYKPIIMHMDLLRINMNETITMNIPLHFIGSEAAPGVKDGGMVSHLLTSVEISCLPAKLPEYIEVDISNLGLNDMVHLSDIKLPKDVTLTELEGDDINDMPVVHITVQKVKEETEVGAEDVAVPVIGEEGNEEK
jgi:large subunit ribosomal protein L25